LLIEGEHPGGAIPAPEFIEEIKMKPVERTYAKNLGTTLPGRQAAENEICEHGASG